MWFAKSWLVNQPPSNVIVLPKKYGKPAYENWLLYLSTIFFRVSNHLLRMVMEPKHRYFWGGVRGPGGWVGWLAITKDSCIGGVLKFEGQRRSFWCFSKVFHPESPWEIFPKFVVHSKESPVDLISWFVLSWVGFLFRVCQYFTL